jgi:hypothetical protein
MEVTPVVRGTVPCYARDRRHQKRPWWPLKPTYRHRNRREMSNERAANQSKQVGDGNHCRVDGVTPTRGCRPGTGTSRRMD